MVTYRVLQIGHLPDQFLPGTAQERRRGRHFTARQPGVHLLNLSIVSRFATEPRFAEDGRN